MHCGTFNLPGTPAAFTQALKQQNVSSRLQILKINEPVAL
jgi:hypothetical protein